MTFQMIRSAEGGYGFVIGRKQRDLLYERIYRHLAGIDAVWRAASAEKFHEADQLGHNLCGELSLVMEDLGWGTRSDERPIEVSTPLAVVRGVLERLRTEAEGLHPEIDLRDGAAENRELIDTCSELLVSLRDQTSAARITGVARSHVEDRLAQKEVLKAVLESAPKPLSPADIGSSIAERAGVPLDAVSHALHELHGMGLIVSEGAGVAASEGLTRVNQLWDNLPEII